VKSRWLRHDPAARPGLHPIGRDPAQIFLLAAWYSLTIPLGEAPDEVPHFTHMRCLAQHGCLPTSIMEHDRVQPGDKLLLHLYWQALRPIDRDLMALIQLVDSEGQLLMYTDGSPTAGRDTTDRWTPGGPLASRHLLAVPSDGQPGEYRPTISLHAFGERIWLPVTGPDGSSLGGHIVLPATIYLIAL